jgi:chromosome segregation ATPase
VASERHAQAEARIQAAMEQLLGGDIPEGLRCDIKSLSTLSGVPRATLYRTYPHLKQEFEQRLGRLREARGEPDPRIAQIDRLKEEVAQLRERISRMNQKVAESEEFQATALSRLAAQHEEITSLRRQLKEATAGGLRVMPSR